MANHTELQAQHSTRLLCADFAGQSLCRDMLLQGSLIEPHDADVKHVLQRHQCSVRTSREHGTNQTIPHCMMQSLLVVAWAA